MPKHRSKPIETIRITIPLISKTISLEDGTVLPGVDVATHCKITGFVANELISRYPEELRNKLFEPGYALLAACHDVGKINPAFQKMIRETSGLCTDSTMPAELMQVNADDAKRNQPWFHGSATQYVFETLARRDSKFENIAKIEGMHHGFKPVANKVETPENSWALLRHELLAKLQKSFPVNGNSWPDLSDWQKACMAGGFITVADWIASGGKFASLCYDTDKSDNELRQMAREAVEEAGFSRQMFFQNLTFKDIFGFPMRKAQEIFINAINGPGVYILEASMGMGKTEAALYAAYLLIEKGYNNGLYFALPTQLTSNKIYERVNQFLKGVRKADSRIPLRLIHSSSWIDEDELNATFGEEGNIGGSWFDAKKRGILAPFGVGTIDQALMAVMNVRHGMVRTYGLAGKVVILDEVHSYDSYTGSILNTLVACLRKLQCTVIILSATLTIEQKRNILSTQSQSVSFNSSYPLITASTDTLRQFPVEVVEHKQVSVQKSNSIDAAMSIAIDKACNGEQILWVLNTVAEAQAIYKQLSAKIVCSSLNIEIGLIHSRFTKRQRNENEGKWVHLFGKNSVSRTERGRILVGTQVLEQSLDIDADYLITALCPTDMLLQRIGRLWRHSENNEVRPNSTTCSVLIVSPEYEEALNSPFQERKSPFGVSASVYSEYVLFRTLEVWNDIKTVRLPDDIRPILEQTYAEREESVTKLKILKNNMEARRELLQQAACITESTEINTMSEELAQTRYVEQESCTVILLKSIKKTDGGWNLVFFGEDNICFMGDKNPSFTKKRLIAKEIMEHTVMVSEKVAPGYNELVQLLSPYIFVGRTDDKEHPVRMVLVGNDEYLYDLNGRIIEVCGKRYSYRSDIGYHTTDAE